MVEQTLTIVDNRTGSSYTLPLVDGAIDAIALRQIHALVSDPGLLSFDPSLENTAVARSHITYIDGDRGILRYRGYDIEDLARYVASSKWLTRIIWRTPHAKSA
jgi:citrate synthase